jgi:hypothetical protein
LLIPFRDPPLKITPGGVTADGIHAQQYRRTMQ